MYFTCLSNYTYICNYMNSLENVFAHVDACKYVISQYANIMDAKLTCFLIALYNLFESATLPLS